MTPNNAEYVWQAPQGRVRTAAEQQRFIDSIPAARDLEDGKEVAGEEELIAEEEIAAEQDEEGRTYGDALAEAGEREREIERDREAGLLWEAPPQMATSLAEAGFHVSAEIGRQEGVEAEAEPIPPSPAHWTGEDVRTPGPWRVATVDNEGDKVDLGRYIVGPDGVLIADTYTDTPFEFGLPDADEAEANARLIAAAPDLLAACLDVLGQDECVCGDSSSHYPCTYCKVRLAVNKADGGSR